MLRLYTGEARQINDALVREIGAALAREDAVQYIIVPKQLTLLTERMLLGGLKLRGSFRLRVLSPARLCSRIFEEAGGPDGVRVDERGRVMLVRRSIRAAKDLTIYKNAFRRRGFADRCARQLEMFIQGGVSAEDLRACADQSAGVSAMKLRDLAAILEEYEKLARDQYQDGEIELIEASARARRAEFIAQGHFWFFGFDITPPTLTRLIAEIAAICPDAEMFFPLIERDRRDYDCYRPLESALDRLRGACRESGAAFARVPLQADRPQGDPARLAREIFAYPVESQAARPDHVHLALARDVRQECMLAAATARRLAMDGMRYGVMQLLCADLESNRQMLIEAFHMYDVPLFLESSRAVSRTATAECLLTALKLIDKNFRSEDVFSLMRSGYMDLSQDEADRLANYAVRKGIEGGRWLRALNRGSEAEIAELEPLRARLMAPVIRLKDALKGADSLRAQLAALFAFLEEIHAHDRSADLQRRLIEGGMRETAGTLAQSWNRIIGALDQMAALMGEDRLSLRELSQTLSESLDAAVIKPLPQSGDAVYAQSIGRMLMQPAGALIIVGMNDSSAAVQDGLLTPAQKQVVAEKTKAYLGPSETDSARLRRFYIKTALGMARSEVYISCALSGADGSAQRPGMIFDLVREIFPQIREMDEDEKQRRINGAPHAALSCAARVFSSERAGDAPAAGDAAAAAALKSAADRMPDVRDRLRRMASLLQLDRREDMDPATARALYGKLQTQSITRLEKFANCPFSYYMNYGLKPEKIEPFELNRRDEGNFLHDAVHEFLRVSGDDLNTMTGDQAESCMDRIACEMLKGMCVGTAMEDRASVRAEGRALRATACRCARVLADHMRGSAFHTSQLERSFGREDGSMQLRAGDTVLEGRIDRVDTWEAGNALRVIDFKLGGKSLNLAGVWHGLRLQLPVYLGAAMKQNRARSAGVYYFALDEGIVNTQTTDPQLVEKERAKDFRLNGLLPSDEDLLAAQSPRLSEVFKAQVTTNGKLYANTPCADEQNFRRLVQHTLKMAQRHLDSIRAGHAAVRPASFDGKDGCAYCDHRSACLFDPRLNADCVRRLKNYKWNEVFEKIALEDE